MVKGEVMSYGSLWASYHMYVHVALRSSQGLQRFATNDRRSGVLNHRNDIMSDIAPAVDAGHRSPVLNLRMEQKLPMISSSLD